MHRKQEVPCHCGSHGCRGEFSMEENLCDLCEGEARWILHRKPNQTFFSINKVSYLIFDSSEFININFLEEEEHHLCCLSQWAQAAHRLNYIFWQPKSNSNCKHMWTLKCTIVSSFILGVEYACEMQIEWLCAFCVGEKVLCLLRVRTNKMCRGNSLSNQKWIRLQSFHHDVQVRKKWFVRKE